MRYLDTRREDEGRKGRKSNRRGYRFRPEVARLEGRALLASFVVSSTNDTGIGSLRAAITSADGDSTNDTITFSSSLFNTAQTIKLGSQLEISKAQGSLTITGPGANLLSVSGNNASRVFQVNTGVTAEIDGLTITGGSTSCSGGGINNQGKLTLNGDAIAGNTAGDSGGGLYSDNGTLALTGCTVSSNTAGYYGGGLESIFGTLALTGCTVSGNTAGYYGGGLFNDDSAVALTDSTFSSNTGGGLYTNNTVALNNTIVAGQTSGADITGQGGFNGSNDLVGVNPMLASLGYYGGTTETMPPLPGSPAIAAGNVALIPAGLTTDQRGEPRALSGAVDIGSVQTQGETLTATSGSGQSVFPGQAFANPLTVAITANDGVDPVNGGVITFAAPPSGASATLSSTSATIVNGSASVNATANGTVGAYSVTAGVSGVASSTSFSLGNLETPSLVVNTTSDVVNPYDNLTSLREAIAYADGLGGGTITFANALAGQTITLGGSDLEMKATANPVTIDASSIGGVAISGHKASRVFQIDNGATVVLNDLSLVNGQTSQVTAGAGVLNNGTATLSNDTISGDSAGISGGGVENTGTLILTSSTVANDSARDGGGISNDGGTLTLTNSTLANNLASIGGGVYNNATLTITNSTLANNSAASGGAVYNGAAMSIADSTLSGNNASNGGGGILSYASVSYTLNNSIVANNSNGDLGGNLNLSGSDDLIDDGGGHQATKLTNSILNQPALLGTLGNYGGPTQTIPLLAGSPAINAGNNALAVDANGNPLVDDQRGIGYSRIIGGTVDLGAYESPYVPTITSVSDDGGLYTGLPYAATGSTTVGGSTVGTPTFTYYLATDTTLSNPLSGAPVNVGNYVVVAGFALQGNDLASSNQASFLITPASPTVTAIDAGGTYNGNPYPATVTVTDVNNNPLNANGVTYTYDSVPGSSSGGAGYGKLIVLPGAPTDAGNYTVVATYPGSADGNYASQRSSPTSFTIAQLAPTINLSAPNTIFSGSPYTPTVSVTGLNGVNLGTPTIQYFLQSDTTQSNPIADPTSVGTYTVVVTYTGSTDYTSATTSANFSIDEVPSLVVNTTADTVNPTDNLTSLREAIAYAETLPGNQTITFAPSVFGTTDQTITLTSGQLNLTDPNGTLTINGPSANLLSVSGGGSSRVFYLNGGTANLSGVTITGGSARNGGGLYEKGGTVTLNGCTVSGNSAVNDGGGLYNHGTLALNNSTVSGNSSGFGGGLYNHGTLALNNSTVSGNSGGFGGGLLNLNGTATLTDSTFSGNSSSSGGGLYDNNGALSLTGCTVSGNSGGLGGGLYDRKSTVTLTDCTVSGNFSQYGGGLYTNTTLPTLNNTIVAGNSGGDIRGGYTGSNDFIGGSPMLASLGYYGGTTETMPPLPGSPVIAAGNVALIPNGITIDQRGEPRTLSGAVDIGAVQTQGNTLTITSGSGQTAVIGRSFASLLTVAVSSNDGVDPVNGGVITFAAPTSGASATLSSTSATITNGSASVTAAANSTPGSYTVTASTSGVTTPALFSLTNVGPPTVTSSTYTNVTSTAATLGGNITETGGVPITGRGVLYAPTSAGVNLTLGARGVTEIDDSAATTGTFAENLSGLNPLTSYSFVAFATNAVGTTYTPVSTFETTEVPSLVVNTTSDVVNPYDGLTSLREAITYAETLSGNQTITFAPSVFGTTAQTITLSSGQLNLTDPNGTLTINGPGANLLSVSGGGSSRVFYLGNGGTASLSGLTVKGGNATIGAGLYDNGGALSLTNCTVSGNSAQGSNNSSGGGGSAAGGGIADAGSAALTLTGSIISGNSVNGGYGNSHGGGSAAGGGINDGGSGAVILNNCTVSGNSANGGGAGSGGVGGGLGGGATGGGINDTGSGTVTLVGCTISANSVTGGASATGSGGSAVGGGINTTGMGTVTLIGSTVNGNSTAGGGGESSNASGGGLNNGGAGTVILSGSTVSGNSAKGGGGIGYHGGTADGGGICNAGAGTVMLNNSTVSANSAQGSGGPGFYNGGNAAGGGLDNAGVGIVTLTNSTISGNSATGGISSGSNGNAAGGGFDNAGSGIVTLNNSIVADTVAGSIAAASANNLLVGTGTVGGLTNGSNGNVIESTASALLLAPLGNYGGSTQTMPPLPGSPAIGAGSAALVPSGVTTDERGEPLNLNGSIDIGAVQTQGYTLTITGGSGQTAVIGTGFTNPLAVSITANDGLDPVNGGTINFAAPGSGASASLSSTSAQISSGQVSTTATANSTVGSYQVAATTAGVTTPAAFTLSNYAIPTFSNLASTTINYGTSSVTLTGTLADGTTPAAGTVTVSISGNGITAISTAVPIASNGSFSATLSTSTLPANTASPYLVTYTFNTQPGYVGTSNNTTTITVNPATLSFSNLSASQTISYGTGSINLTGNLTSNTSAIPPGSVTISINGAQVSVPIGVGGAFSTSISSAAIPASNTPYTITYSYVASNNGTTNFTNASNTSSTLTVNPAAPTFSNLASTSMTYGTASVTFSGTLAAGNIDATGNLTVTISGNQITPIADHITIQPNGTFAATFSTNTLPASPTGSPYTITYSYTSQANFQSASNSSTTLTVTPKALFVTANNQQKTYGQTVTFTGTAFTTSGLINSDQITGVTLTSTGSAANANATVGGSPYAITVSNAVGTGLSNYSISYVNGSLSVAKAQLTVSANSLQKIYGQALTASAYTGTLVGVVAGDSITATFDSPSGDPATATVAGGPYTIFATLNDPNGRLANYIVTNTSGSLTVAKAALTITLDNASKTYGTLATFGGTAFTETGLVTANGDTITGVTETSTGAAISATVSGSPYAITSSAATGSGLSNYTISYNSGTLTVNKASLTITANSASKTYGTLSTFGSTAFTETGLVTSNGDTITGVTETSIGAAVSATVGADPIVPSAATGSGLSNYTISYNSGTLTVNKANLIITANSASKTYGSLATFGTTAFTETGLVTANGDSITGVTETSNGAAVSATVSGSPYAITASAATGNGLANYTITYSSGLLTVNPAQTNLVLSSSNNTGVVGQPLTFTAIVSVVSPGGGVPQGNVVFKSGTTILATVPLAVVNGTDQAVVTTSSLPAGATSVIATYVNTDGNDIGSSSSLNQSVLGSGVYAIGTTLYVIGGNTSDYALISPWGSKLDGSTGLAVAATLNNSYTLVAFTQTFTAIDIFGYNGNDGIQLIPTLTLPTTVVEGNGNNYIALANGNDTVTLGSGSNQVFGGNGNKTVTEADVAGTSSYIQLGLGNETISLGAGNDQVVMGGGTNVVTAGNGSDAVTAGNGNNTIQLGIGNDYIQTGVGTDTIALGSGNENVQLGGGNKSVVAGGGNNYVSAGTGTDSVTMGSGNDNVQLGDGNNTVSLGNGNDYIQAGNGTNTIAAGSATSVGNVQVQLGNGNSNAVTLLGNGTDYVQVGNGTGDVVSITGNGNDQIFTGSGAGDIATINGNGNDYLQLSNGNGDAATINGNGTAQIQIGSGTNDTVTMVGNGSDTVQTGNGSGKAHVSGTGKHTVHLGNGWTTN